MRDRLLQEGCQLVVTGDPTSLPGSGFPGEEPLATRRKASNQPPRDPSSTTHRAPSPRPRNRDTGAQHEGEASEKARGSPGRKGNAHRTDGSRTVDVVARCRVRDPATRFAALPAVWPRGVRRGRCGVYVRAIVSCEQDDESAMGPASGAKGRWGCRGSYGCAERGEGRVG